MLASTEEEFTVAATKAFKSDLGRHIKHRIEFDKLLHVLSAARTRMEVKQHSARRGFRTRFDDWTNLAKGFQAR